MSENEEKYEVNTNKIAILKGSLVFVKLSLFLLWPLSFLVGLTIVGAKGAGFQSRFLLPFLPASAVLSVLVGAIVESHLQMQRRLSVLHIVAGVTVSLFDLLLFFSAIQTAVYGVLFPPLFGDLDSSVMDMVTSMLDNSLLPVNSREVWEGALMFLRHFGINR